MARNKKAYPESIKGMYSSIPWDVQDSEAFRGATHQARSLLFELMRQHNGSNNGRLQLTASWLAPRGWKAGDVVRRARDNLLERRLVALTRKGGRTIGADWFALTWHDISNFVGLDIRPTEYHKGAYRLVDAASPIRGSTRKPPRKRKATGVYQRSPALSNIAAPEPSALSNSAITPQFDGNAALSNSDDVIIAIEGRQHRQSLPAGAASRGRRVLLVNAAAEAT